MTAPDIANTVGEATATKGRDPRLEGLRGYLALGVLVFHVAFAARISSFLNDSPAGIWTVLADGLYVALPPFFVLSGNFLYRPFIRSVLAGTPRPRPGRFLSGRLLRLLPAYYLLLAVSLPVFNLHSVKSVWYVLRPVLLMDFYWPPNTPWIVGIEPTWTVPAEILFYVSLPLLAILAGRYARGGADLARRARRSLVSAGLLALIGLVWTVYTLLPAAQMTVAAWNLWYWPFAYYDAFAVGMVLATLGAYAEVSGTTPAFYGFVRRRPLVCWLVALAAFLLDLPRPFGKVGVGNTGAEIQSYVVTVLVLVFAGFIVAPLTVPGVRSRFMDAVLANPPMRYLGRISYGVYLWHVSVIYLVCKQGYLFADTPPKTGPFLRAIQPYGFFELFVYTVAATVAVATVSYYCLEQPILRLYRSRLRPLSAPVQVPLLEAPWAVVPGTAAPALAGGTQAEPGTRGSATG